MPDMAGAPLPRPCLHVILYPDSFFLVGVGHALTVLLGKSVSTTPYHVYIGMGET